MINRYTKKKKKKKKKDCIHYIKQAHRFGAKTGNPHKNNIKQVAQRATIAHLSPVCQHPLISNKPASKVIKNLNSFQIREQLFFLGLSTSNVSGLNVPEIKPLVVFKHVLVTKEQASMETSLSHFNSLEYFSNTQGQLIPQ